MKVALHHHGQQSRLIGDQEAQGGEAKPTFLLLSLMCHLLRKNKQCVQLMGFYCNLCRFVAKTVIHAVLSRNLFCHNLRAFMWRKIEPKSTFVEKK